MQSNLLLRIINLIDAYYKYSHIFQHHKQDVNKQMQYKSFQLHQHLFYDWYYKNAGKFYDFITNDDIANK